MQGAALYKVATQGIATPRVLIVDDLSDYAMGLSKNIREAVGTQTIVGTESLIKSKDATSWQNDWASAVSKVKTLGVNVVIYTGYYAQGAAFFTHLKMNGYTGILAGGDGVLDNSIFKVGVPTPFLEGVRISSPYGLVSDINTDLENNFKQVIGRASEIFAPESIDATNVLLSCIASGVTSRIEMLACIDKFSGTSIYGHKFSFDVNGDVVPQNFYEFEIRSGAIKYKDNSTRSTQSSDVIIESFPWYYALKYSTSKASLVDWTCRPTTKTAKVGLAYDIGGRGDKSFNDSAATAIDWLRINCGTSVQEVTLTTGSDSEREDKLRLLAKAGYNPIIAVGFLYAGPIKAVASDYPNVQFGIIDDSSVDLLNVAGLVFAEEQGSYLAGVAAALASKSGKVGYIGGVRIPLLQKFEAGFVAGVKATKKSVTVDVKYVTEPPDFGGFNDPAKAKVIAKGMIDKGIDVIYSAAGGSGAGNFAAATDAAKAGKKVWTIGVDSDQYLSASAAEKKNMLTSMIKRVDRAVYDVIATAVAGSSVNDVLDESGIYGRVYNLSLDGVGVSYSGGYINKYKAQIDKAAAAIKSGKIKVPTKP
jgi:basic membrane protein A